ncbi:PKD domain-containing protein [Actinoplanes sp. NPDC051851]|uniref:PKD domain-containing protein n=1 Tax=Actinoplanes sp. NPDC051851 TaxID=3154753 RepID=UPI003419C051
MKSNLTRPLLAAIVSGAVVAGGAVYASPALAGGKPIYAAPILADEPTADETSPSADPTTESAEPEDTTSTSASAEPSDTSSTSASAEPSDTSSTSASAEPSDSSAAPSESASTDPGDITPPTGTFKLNGTALLLGQQITFSQLLTDFSDEDPDASIVRVISWGDGTTTTLKPGDTAFSHRYTKTGTFKVTETLTDTSGNVGPAATTATVKVTTPTVKVSTSKTSVWIAERYVFKVNGVPAGTKKVIIDWGDGYRDTFAWKGKALSFNAYYQYLANTDYKIVTGKRQMKIAYISAFGESSYVNAVAITVKKDSWKPVAKAKKPSSANRLKSWKTVTGTVTDKGAGVKRVYVYLEQYSKGKSYCLNKNKKWQKFTDSSFSTICYDWAATVSGGKWKFKVPSGTKKGDLWVGAYAIDWSDNVGGVKYVHAKITKS